MKQNNATTKTKTVCKQELL